MLQSGEIQAPVTGMSRSASDAWTLPSAKKAFIRVEERWFWTYVTSALGSLSNCYGRQGLEGGRINLLGVLTMRYKIYEELQ